MSTDQSQTSELVAALAVEATVVPENRVPVRLLASLGLGVMAAIVLQMQTIGLRDDAGVTWTFIGAKLTACLVMAVVWFWLLRHLAAPGQGTRTQRIASLAALTGTVGLAMFAPFEFAPLKGCVSQVLLLATPAFIAIFIALRSCAPTRLTEAGFVAGIVAGALGAVGYSLGCMADDASVVAFRYGVSVLVCGGLGAMAGRLALRW